MGRARVSVMVVTTGRADYSLLRPLIRELAARPGRFDVSVAATGSHLAEAQGRTISDILDDGWPRPPFTVEMTPDDGSEAAVCRAVSRGLAGFSALLERERPGLMAVLGDRFELWAACPAAVLLRVPIAHIHGGEATYGAVDEAIRHSVTKMASLHFPSLPEYARRIIRMGEPPSRVTVAGALGVDSILSTPILDPRALSARVGLDFLSPAGVALATFHPVTLDGPDAARGQAAALFDALEETGMAILATMPNADAGGPSVAAEIEARARRSPGRLRLAASLGPQGYASAMAHARVMAGNSSSGIVEAASFRLPVVNVGDRQDGRVRPKNVIDCPCERDAIARALRVALSDSFRRSLDGLQNPYGDGRAAMRIADALEAADLSDLPSLLKKRFHDEGGPAASAPP